VILLLATTAAVPLPIALGAALLVLSGFSASNTMAMANTIVQTTAPDNLRGRVMAVYSTVFMGSAPIGALIAGAISDRFSVETSMFVGGTMVTIVAATLFWLQRERKRIAASVPVPGRPASRRPATAK